MLRRGGLPLDRASPARGDDRRGSACRDRPAERRSGRRRLHRAASAAEAHFGAEGDRGDRSAQGRGRVSSGQYGADDFGPARLSARYARRDSGVARVLQDRNRRKALRRDRPQQHRRPSDRQSAVAEGLGLHGNALSQPDEESRGGRSRRRHRNRRAGQGRVRHGRHDQAGRGSRRRGYHARAERPDQVGVEIAGRRQVRRGGSQVQLHNAGPGRSRADDDHLADEKYAESGSRGSVRKVTLPGAWHGEE